MTDITDLRDISRVEHVRENLGNLVQALHGKRRVAEDYTGEAEGGVEFTLEEVKALEARARTAWDTLQKLVAEIAPMRGEQAKEKVLRTL